MIVVKIHHFDGGGKSSGLAEHQGPGLDAVRPGPVVRASFLSLDGRCAGQASAYGFLAANLMRAMTQSRPIAAQAPKTARRKS